MQCPKCNAGMESVKHGNIEVDRCTSCKGIWFDQLEKDDLKQIEGSESIDIGDSQVGEEYNAIRRIECPKCHTNMIPMVDRDQHHIKYESCAICFGTFFDAGEFTDFKEKTVIERFQRLLDVVRSNIT